MARSSWPGRSRARCSASLTEVDLANASFPWLTGRIITVAGAEDVRALRINYVGELG